MPLLCLPTVFQCPFLGVLVAETVNTIRQAGSWITFGGLAIENALELGFDVFSAGYVAHEEIITTNCSNWKMIIHLLSKRHFTKTLSGYNMSDLFIILAAMLATCEGERGRGRERRRWAWRFPGVVNSKPAPYIAARQLVACQGRTPVAAFGQVSVIFRYFSRKKTILHAGKTRIAVFGIASAPLWGTIC